MIKELPTYIIRLCDGPRGRGKRLFGYAQLRGTVVLIEAEAAGRGHRTRTRAIPADRAEKILALGEVAARAAGPATSQSARRMTPDRRS